MIEITFQGRGGQGVVVASEILAHAAFKDGHYPQCYSIFGGERRGAPVAAFVRISDRKIYLKCDIEYPDHLVIFDETVSDLEKTVRQVAPGGTILINTEGGDMGIESRNYRIGTINAREIAHRNGLGDIINTALLGAYVRMSGIVSLDMLTEAIGEFIPASAEHNMAAAREAYDNLVVINGGA